MSMGKAVMRAIETRATEDQYPGIARYHGVDVDELRVEVEKTREKQNAKKPQSKSKRRSKSGPVTDEELLELDNLGASEVEISRRLGIPIGAVKSRVRRARRRTKRYGSSAPQLPKTPTPIQHTIAKDTCEVFDEAKGPHEWQGVKELAVLLGISRRNLSNSKSSHIASLAHIESRKVSAEEREHPRQQHVFRVAPGAPVRPLKQGETWPPASPDADPSEETKQTDPTPTEEDNMTATPEPKPRKKKRVRFREGFDLVPSHTGIYTDGESFRGVAYYKGKRKNFIMPAGATLEDTLARHAQLKDQLAEEFAQKASPEIKKLLGRVQELEQALDESTAKADDLEASFDDASKLCDQLEQRVAELAAELANTNAANAELQAHIDSSSTHFVSIREVMSRLLEIHPDLAFDIIPPEAFRAFVWGEQVSSGQAAS